jgi:hypothetical protein
VGYRVNKQDDRAVVKRHTTCILGDPGLLLTLLNSEATKTGAKERAAVTKCIALCFGSNPKRNMCGPTAASILRVEVRGKRSAGKWPFKDANWAGLWCHHRSHSVDSLLPELLQQYSYRMLVQRIATIQQLPDGLQAWPPRDLYTRYNSVIKRV